MATWYVRKTGSNSNNGTSSSTAFLTVNYALTTAAISPGDTIYVGAGVYRETLAPTHSGTLGSLISVIADVDGSHTGDAGQVTITAFTTNDTTAPSATTLIAFSTYSYLSFSLFTFILGTGKGVTNTTGVYHTFTDCTFNGLYPVPAPYQDYTFTYTAPAGSALGLTITRCTIIVIQRVPVCITLPETSSGSADYDALTVISNSQIIVLAATANTTYSTGIYVANSGSGTYLGGGVRVYNCFISSYTGMLTTTGLSTNIPCEIHNSVIVADAGLNVGTAITESYNLYFAITAGASGGAGSVYSGRAPLVELGQAIKWAAGTVRPFLAPDGVGSPLLGFGSAGTGGNYPTVDWMNRPRPSGGESASYSVGHLERHDFAIQDTSIYNDAPSSGELVGPGDQFIQVPVNSGSSTISIYLRYDSYGGSTLPSATLLPSGELGIATQTVSCTSAASGAFQQLTFSAISASKAGWVTLQITSYDANGTGTVHFDTLAVA